MTGIIDSHAHICGEELFPRLQEVAKRAKDEGIEKIMVVCSDLREVKRALAAAAADSMFDVAVGFHPNEALKISREDWEELKIVLENPRVKAVGEIGMDYFSYETIVPKVL